MSEDLIDALFDDLDEPAAEEDLHEDTESEEEVANLYGGVAEFVQDFLAVIYARPVGAAVTGFRWCPQWWDHPEAVARLEALWKAFEVLRQDPGTGAATWWRDYADPTMTALCAADGTFKACSDEAHRCLPDLPILNPPPGFTSSDQPGRTDPLGVERS